MSLKSNLDSPRTPLRQFFDAELPSCGNVLTAVSAQLRAATMLEPPPDVDASVIGHAISAAVGWHLSGHLLTSADFSFGFRQSPVIIPMSAIDGPTGDRDHDARLAWLAGLADRATRTPDGYADPAVAPLTEDDLDAALAAVPVQGAQHVVELLELFSGDLATLTAAGPAIVAPTFAGSAAVGGADADAICGHTLVEIKATKASRGRDIRQLIGYVLLDYNDEYTIDTVALAYLRHGLMLTWSVDEFLSACGATKSLAELRTGLEATLSTDSGRGANRP